MKNESWSLFVASTHAVTCFLTYHTGNRELLLYFGDKLFYKSNCYHQYKFFWCHSPTDADVSDLLFDCFINTNFKLEALSQNTIFHSNDQTEAFPGGESEKVLNAIN